MKLKPQSNMKRKSVEELKESMGVAYKDLSVQVAYKEGYNKAVDRAIEKLQEQSKEYEEELVRLRTYWKKKLQEERERVIELYKSILKVCERYYNEEMPTTNELKSANEAIDILDKLKSEEEHDH